MKTLLMVILSITLTTNCLAQNIVKIEKDTPAPFTGFLLKKERLEKAYKAEKINIQLKDLNSSQGMLIEYHKRDARLQREKLSEAKFDAHVRSIGYFVLGVIITGFAFKATEEFKR